MRYLRVYAKVGTIPMMIYLRSKKPFAVGDKIQFRDRDKASWERGIVTCLDPLKMDKW